MFALIEPFEMRAGVAADVDALVKLSTGPIADKRTFIVESIVRRNVLIACVDGIVAGYLIWDRTFFGRPFVWLLGVDRAYRRRGIASRLLGAFERACQGEPRFTSTNESNLGMQALLVQQGFTPSGRLENLDPGDPELFFFKAGFA